MKNYSFAARGLSILMSGVIMASCSPQPEPTSGGVAPVQNEIATEPIAKPTSRTPVPTPLPTKAGVKVKTGTKKPNVKVKPAKTASSATRIIDGMRVTDIRKGTGAEAVTGKTVVVDYRGTLLNGVQFDASYDRGEPFSFQLGAQEVIQGWDKGVAGMKVGGKRRLLIPPDLGYGAQGMGSAIPPNATLIFEVELKAVQ